MDRSLDRRTWQIVIASVRRAAKVFPSAGRRPVYPNGLIVAMYLWAVWHDRCLSWACERDHYNSLFRPRKLPSVSQFTRRLKHQVSQAILQWVHDDLAKAGIASTLSYIDAKPVLVSPVSKDPDAGRGRISGGYGKGYKLHAYITQHRRIAVWCVTPLNSDEKTVARQALIPHLPPVSDCASALTLADKGYDAAPLYKAIAQRGDGHALLAPVRGEQFVGEQGRTAQVLRDMGPQRRAALVLWEKQPALMGYVMEQRNNAEGVFSVLAMTLGLGALPGFVRRLERVKRWIGSKIILDHSRLLAQERALHGVAA
jgi:hypothetical protein